MIDILLSTYNGQLYLSQQIESILHQTWADWHLYIRDDGSTDNTAVIIEQYVSAYPKQITWINKQDVHNVGVIKSFQQLLEHSTAPYFMFCDQDDVWLPSKIEHTYQCLKNEENQMGNDKPIVVHTDAKVVDANLQVMNPSFFDVLRFPYRIIATNKHYAMLFNYITGCTVMGNAKAREVSLPFPSFIDMHDSWVARKAWLEQGKVVSLLEPTMLYRQHGGNVLGAGNKLTLKKRMQSFVYAYKQYRLLYKKHRWMAPFSFIYYKCKFNLLYANNQ